jgi:hypothetical protein
MLLLDGILRHIYATFSTSGFPKKFYFLKGWVLVWEYARGWTTTDTGNNADRRKTATGLSNIRDSRTSPQLLYLVSLWAHPFHYCKIGLIDNRQTEGMEDGIGPNDKVNDILNWLLLREMHLLHQGSGKLTDRSQALEVF